MNSRIYDCLVAHSRHAPVGHAFRYRVPCFCFDLDELEELPHRNPLFGHNRLRPVSLYDKDYLCGEGSLREKLLRLLSDNGVDAEGVARILLVTMPRIWGYSFNPVSFYFLRDREDSLLCAVAEVNNTFSERHFYILQDPAPTRGSVHFKAAKVFHVSPFFERDGEYEFLFDDPLRKLDLHVNLYREGKRALSSSMQGEPRPLTLGALAGLLARYPFSAFLTLPRIVREAASLYYSKKLPVHAKPELASDLSLSTSKPGLRDRVARGLLFQRLRRLVKGRLTIIETNGAATRFEGTEPGREATLRIRDPKVWGMIVAKGDIGFGEAYTEGLWSSEDPAELLLLLLENRDYLEDWRFRSAFLAGLGNRLFARTHRNTITQAKKNIHAHYDLGNEFFRLFLDETMTYSCALFSSPDESLEKAQMNKICHLLGKLKLDASQHLLEIGCGWGRLCLEAVRKYGCCYTGITLSEEQAAHARELFQQERISPEPSILLQDYRQTEGHYDRIISVEMFEAVGLEYLGEFFKVCDRLLKENGVAVLQIITIAEERYEAYAQGCDWIQKHIFPGGFLPSLTVLKEAIASSSSLVIRDIESIGKHYAPTLREWKRRLLANRDQVLAQGRSPEFLRKWEYYFNYCEAGFASGALDTVQIVLGKPGSQA